MAVRNKSKAKEIEPAVVVGIRGADGPKGGQNLRLYLFRYVTGGKVLFRSILGIIRGSADTINSLELPDFEKRVSESKIDLNLFLGVGELEEKFLPSMEKWGYDKDKFRQEISYVRMVGNAQDLANQIGPYFEQNKLRFSFNIFKGQTHNSAPWSAVNPVLDFEYSLIDEDAQSP